MPRKLSTAEMHVRTARRAQRGILEAAPALSRIAHGQPPRPGCPPPTPKDVLKALFMLLRLRDDTEKQMRKAAEEEEAVKELAVLEEQLEEEQRRKAAKEEETEARIAALVEAARETRLDQRQ